MYSDTILIIDDDLFNRGILDNLFSPYYAVEEAENGRVGLDKILASPGTLLRHSAGCGHARDGWP